MKEKEKENLELMYLSAIRYALPRRTYVTRVAIEWTIMMKDQLRDGWKKLVIKEIEDFLEQNERDKLVDECDARNWRETLKILKGE